MARPDFETQSRIIPIGFVNDFRNGLSPVECEIAIRNVYEDRDLRYQPPHVISDVDAFDTTDGAFHVRQIARGREERPTVIAAVVDPGVGTDRRAVVVTTAQDHTFIGPDNNVLGPALAEEEITGAYRFRPEIFQKTSNTFHGRDVFAPAAARVSSGEKPGDMTDILEPVDPEGVTIVRFKPETVVHVDGYGGDEYARHYGGNVKFELQGIPLSEAGDKATAARLTLPRHSKGIPRKHLTVPVRTTFGEAKPGEFLLYVGSSGGGVELAVNGGNGNRSSAGRLKLHTGDSVGFNWRFPGQNATKRRQR
jgi:S-adenosylmethionine hydrolase